MAQYEYEPLTEPRQIRLLHLLPGIDEVHFTLELINLNNNPDYEAVSYCWGDAADTRTVYCEEQPLQITVSLFTALRQLRLPDRCRTLWADAVCINQDDRIEKGSQVTLMSQIFSKTSRILIWLGEDKAGLEGVGESITEALTFMPPESYDSDEITVLQQQLFRDTIELRKQGKPNMFDHDWSSMNRLLLRPWFERKWIIQEVAMAPNSIPRLMMCGDIELSWSSLASLNYRISAYGAVWPLCGLSVVNDHAPHMASFWINEGKPQYMASNTFMTMLMKHFRSQGTLLDCFVAAAAFRCSDDRDHLYALLSLPGSAGIEPDYTLSAQEVWERFAISTLVGDQNLKFLTLASCMAIDGPSSQPSWIPAVDGRIIVNPLTSFTIRPQCFRAGGSITAPIAVSANNRRLNLSGRIIDTIKVTTRGLFDIPIPSDADILPKTGFASLVMMWKRIWFQECRDLAADGDWSKLAPGQRRAFFTTMICGMTSMRDPAPEETIDAFQVYFDHVTGFFTSGHVLSDTDWDLILTQAPLIEHSLISYSAGLRFCITEELRFAQVTKSAKTGDRICLLGGAEVPYILRPEAAGTYRLVGQGYIHGVMQGEVLAEERYKTETIILT